MHCVAETGQSVARNRARIRTETGRLVYHNRAPSELTRASPETGQRQGGLRTAVGLRHKHTDRRDQTALVHCWSVPSPKTGHLPKRVSPETGHRPSPKTGHEGVCSTVLTFGRENSLTVLMRLHHNSYTGSPIVATTVHIRHAAPGPSVESPPIGDRPTGGKTGVLNDPPILSKYTFRLPSAAVNTAPSGEIYRLRHLSAIGVRRSSGLCAQWPRIRPARDFLGKPPLNAAGDSVKIMHKSGPN